MSASKTLQVAAAVLIALLAESPATALNIDLVPVGNTANSGELSGAGAGKYGPDRICGAVGYAYEMGTYEVTAGQYTEFLNAVAKSDPYGLYSTYMADSVNNFGCNIQRTGSSGSYTYSVAGDWADRPVNWVSWGDSARFANWIHNGQPSGPLTGNPVQDTWLTEGGSYAMNGATSNAALLAVTREANATWVLPSEDEWYKAAYHKNDGDTGNYWDYPTGSDVAPGRDMTEATNPGNNANYLGSPFPIDSPHYTTVVGEFELSDSPYGTFDMGGNVWEWNEAVIGSIRGLRGGSFDDIVQLYLHAAYRLDFYGDPAYEDGYIGFRVARIPEPATIVIMALAALGLHRRKSTSALNP